MKSELDALLEDPPRLALLAPWMLAVVGVITVLLLAGCASSGATGHALRSEVRTAVAEPAKPGPAPLPQAVANALVPPADLSMPSTNRRTSEPHFDLTVTGLPAAQVFAALVRDTPYSMLVDPSLTMPVTAHLKSVTLVEALDSLREMYGFEYRVQGKRVFVQPARPATRMFQVNHLAADRSGNGDPRTMSASRASSQVAAPTRIDVWAELEASLRLLVGADGTTDRSVTVSPRLGVVVVRGLPKELRAVEDYLRIVRRNSGLEETSDPGIDEQSREGSHAQRDAARDDALDALAARPAR